MKSIFVTMGLLASVSSMADINLNSKIDLSICKKGDQAKKTGLSGNLNITSTIAMTELVAVHSSSQLSQFGGYDGDPATYSCDYITNWGTYTADTIADIDGVGVFKIQRDLSFDSFDKSDSVEPNAVCDAKPVVPYMTSISLVPTEAGQVVVTKGKKVILVNFHTSLAGQAVESNLEKKFAIDASKNESKINFSIFRKNSQGTDIELLDCEATINIR